MSVIRLLRRIFIGSKKQYKSLHELESVIGYRFRDIGLLRQALTHRSILSETGEDYCDANEIMEFLGDAVLELIVVEFLVRKFPKYREGELSRLKSILVSGKELREVALKIDIGRFILLSQNEERNGGRSRGSILKDAMEALIAAIYFDSGIGSARKFVNRWILTRVDELVRLREDPNYKSQQLEFAQAHGVPAPIYNVTAEQGPDHNKRFDVEVVVDGAVIGVGWGRSKKSAQQEAAANAMPRLTELYKDDSKSTEIN